MPRARPKICILYHFFHPDDVVSARHFSDLAEGIANAGWDVEVLPSNRACRNSVPAIYRPRALDCFLRTRMDVLVLGSFLLLETGNESFSGSRSCVGSPRA